MPNLSLMQAFLYGLFYSCKESKKEWTIRNSELDVIGYVRHPTTLEEFLAVDSNSYAEFDFQRSINIEAINMDTNQLDRKAHLFWKIPAIDAKVTE